MKKNNKNYGIYFIIAGLIFMLLFSAIILKNVIKSNNEKETDINAKSTDNPMPTETPEPTEVPDFSITMSFAGDCTFGMQNENTGNDMFPTVYEKSGSVTYPFDKVMKYFTADDYTTINFEGTLTDSTSQADKPWRFRGSPEYSEILKKSSVEIALTANNHAFDYLQQGYDDTVSSLNNSGVKPLGNNEVYKTTKNGYEIVMISAGFVVIEDTNVMEERYRDVLKLIENNQKENNLVVVNLHWGNELQTVPSEAQQKVAHMFVDAGADLIVGHHPHLLQGIEYYKGTYIVYSLGNFAFGGNRSAKNADTAIFVQSWTIKDGKVISGEGSIVPCYITSTEALSYRGILANNFQPMPLTGDKKEKNIALILERSSTLEYGITDINVLD